VRRLDDSGRYPVGSLLGDVAWTEALGPGELAEVFRASLRDEYADAGDAEMGDALENILDSMSAAEAFNFGSALSQIGKSASKLAADPAFAQIVRTAAPIAGGALGTVIGGPVGTALGTQLGSLAASALPAPPAPARAAVPPAAVPSAPVPPAPVSAPVVPPAPVSAAVVPSAVVPPAVVLPVPVTPAVRPPEGPVPTAAGRGAVIAPSTVTGPPDTAPRPTRPSSVAEGSAAAAQGLVLCQQPDVLCGLLATALGQHGRQHVSGVPVAQLLTLFSQVIGQAAADADELMYLEQQPGDAESALEDTSSDSVRSLYADLLGADNLELAEAAGWEGLG
jgi:hypothetical protein